MGSCLTQEIRTKRLIVASLRPPARTPRLCMSPGSISGVALNVRGCLSHEDPSIVYTLRSYLAQKLELFSSRCFFLCVCVLCSPHRFHCGHQDALRVCGHPDGQRPLPGHGQVQLPARTVSGARQHHSVCGSAAGDKAFTCLLWPLHSFRNIGH